MNKQRSLPDISVSGNNTVHAQGATHMQSPYKTLNTEQEVLPQLTQARSSPKTHSDGLPPSEVVNMLELRRQGTIINSYPLH